MRVLHLSDVHIPLDVQKPVFHGGWRCAMAQLEMRVLRRATKFVDAGAVLRRIVEDADRLAVDHVILSGDLTTLALDEEFETTRDALRPLVGDRARLTLVPGNHDRYTPSSLSERRFERHFAEHLVNDMPEYAAKGAFPLVRLVGDHLAVVGLDSSLVPPFPGLAFGRVGRAQLDALRRILGDLRVRGRKVLVTLHHGPYDVDGKVEARSRGLRDAGELLSLCREAGVAGLLHGHVHHRFERACPSHGVPIFSAGSSTQLDREGYWLYELCPSRGLMAEDVDLSAGAPGFAAASAAGF